MESSNKTIAKNAVLLYVRMIISMLIGLYTSRVVLQTLGFEDFGIYGLVGGVVAMFSFLNASMSGATSRFLTFELGKKDGDKLQRTFNSAFLLHAVIALIVFLIAETVGLWMIYNKLVIPEDRFHIAIIVYQLSILSMIITVTQVPYNASIIAHEKMDVYAYVELLNVFLKLAIVYLLVFFDIDKLLLYACLMLAVSIIIALIYRIYCINKFDECKIKPCLDKDILLPMIKFSGWDLYGNMCVTFRQQGITMIINMFFGVIFNAANTISTQVQSAIFSLSSNVIQAYRPPIIKKYACSDYEGMDKLVKYAIICSVLLYAIMAIPIVCKMDLILTIWLGDVPEYTSVFCIFQVITGLFIVINSVINIITHSSGKVKTLSVFSGSMLLLNVVFVYFMFRLINVPAYWAYVLWLITMFLVLFVDICIARRNVPYLSYSKYVRLIVKLFTILIISFISTEYISNISELNFIQLVLAFCMNGVIIALLAYMFVADRELKTFLKSLLIKNIKNEK